MRTVLIIASSLVILGQGSGAPIDLSPDRASETPNVDYFKGILGGKHDFSTLSGAAGDACSGCHVPHQQAVRAGTQPAASALELYRIEGQRRVFVTDRYTPGPTSLVCLGCHDGTIATSTIGSAHALLAGVREGFAVPDGFAGRDHPIGVPYPSARREYHPASFAEAKGIRLPEGRIECISCHDPHGESAVDKMLIMSNRRSALCLACHVK